MLKQALRVFVALSFILFTNLLWAAKAVNYTPPDFVPDQVVSDDKTIFLLSKSNKAIYRWSIATSAYLSPLSVGLVKDTVEYMPTTIEVAPGHSRLYVGYETGDIRYLTLTTTAAERNFAKTELPIKHLAAAGKYLIAIDGTSDWSGNRYSFNNRGTKVDQSTNSLGYRHLWSPADSKIYLMDGNWVASTSIDQKTGKFEYQTWSGFTSSNYDQNNPLMSISADGQYLLVSDGRIKHAKWQVDDVSLGRYLEGGKVLADNSVVTLALKNYYTTPATLLLEMRDPKLRLVEQREFQGSLHGVYGTATKLALVFVKDNKVSIETYVPNQDSDSDGVKNSVDAFPLDPAASKDTDKDGYPDSWNRNFNASNTPTSLVLDAYPKDAECFNQAQGNGKSCDYSLLVPDYLEADQTLSDGKIVYFFSSQQKNIYRWSLETASYLSPLKVGMDAGYSTLFPTAMTISMEHKRIYLGYSTGAVTFIQLTGSTIERSFTSIPTGVRDLEAVGKYLLVYDEYTRAKRTFDLKGVQRDKFDSWQRMLVRQSVWDPVLSRLYFVEFLQASHFRYVTVNQSTGKTSDVYYSPFGKSEAGRSISVSIDGSKILVGNGDIFNSKDFTLTASLGQKVDAGRWLADGSVVRARTVNSQVIVEWFGKDFQRIDERSFDGSNVVGLFGTDKKLYLLVFNNGRLTSYTYEPKSDSDGDRVPNQLDAFPNDPAASVDTDNDGYPDRWNTGKNASHSTSGLTLDAYPNDSACYLPEHGDGTDCDYAATMPDFIPDQIVSDNEVIYYLSKANSRIYRWSIADNKFINPMVVGVTQGLNRYVPRKMALSMNHGRIYLGYETGQVRYINLNGNKEYDFSAVAMSVNGMAAVGDYLMVQDSSGAWATHYIFNAAGTLTDSKDWNYFSREYAWDSVNSKVYFFRDDTSPNDLQFEVVDQTNGKIIQEGETPYHGAYNTSGVIRVSVDGTRVLLGSGDIYNGLDLTWATSVGEATDARWLADNSLVTVKNIGGEIVVERRNANMQVVEQRVFAGEVLGIFGSDTEMTLAAFIDGELSAYTYVPSDDSDNDGVANTLDVFPLDPAASVDTDNDGHPDSWNPGYTQADSTTHLTLDAYPQDAACYLPAHGNGSDCDFGATIPNYTPDQIASDANYIYLLSKANKRIYRWSLAERKYVNPFVIGYQQGITSYVPTRMAVSEAHQRIYLGYESGVIRYLDLQAGRESAFASIAKVVRGLASVGNYLLAQDESGAWAAHYILDENGIITDQKEWNRYSREYAWNTATSRVYFFRDQTSPNDLHFEVVDQSTGKITEEGETPYHGTYSINPPIRVSTDGSRVLIGGGNIFQAPDLLHEATLGASVQDALWASSALITLENNQLKVRSLADYSELQSFAISGTALRILADGQNVVVIHSVNGAIQFTHYAIGDNDGDGLPKWWEDASGLNDDYAGDGVLDSDGDLLTNLEEYHAKTNPNIVDSDTDGISDGDEVKTYLTSPIKTDTDTDGLNDFAEVFTYQTNPLAADTDDDSFSDYLEVILYNSDPNSTASIPPAITSMQESFEAPSLSPLWVAGTNSKADWAVDSASASAGTNSIRSGAIGHSERSSVVYKGLFAAGTLSFYARVEAEGCCDQLHLYVDGEWTLSVSSYSGSWAQYSVPLTSGMHEIEWRYQKDGSVVYGADAAWIDQVEFIAN